MQSNSIFTDQNEKFIEFKELLKVLIHHVHPIHCLLSVVKFFFGRHEYFIYMHINWLIPMHNFPYQEKNEETIFIIALMCDISIRKLCGFIGSLGCSKCYITFPCDKGHICCIGFNVNEWSIRNLVEH